MVFSNITVALDIQNRNEIKILQGDNSFTENIM